MEPLVTTSLERTELRDHGFVWSDRRGRFIESSEGPFIDEVIKVGPEPVNESNAVLAMLGDLIKVVSETQRQIKSIETESKVDRQAPPLIEVKPQIEIMLPSDLIHPELTMPDVEEVVVVERDEEGFISRLAKRFIKLSDQPEGPPSLRDQVRNSLGLST